MTRGLMKLDRMIHGLVPGSSSGLPQSGGQRPLTEIEMIFSASIGLPFHSAGL